MICPKCGRYNEGSKCPYCDELEINDKTSEYEEKRKAYEAAKKASDNAENKDDGPGVDRSKEARSKRKFNIVRYWKPIVIVGAAAVAAIILFKIVDFSPKRTYSGTVYYRNDGQIYRLSESGATAEGNTGDIFTSNKSRSFSVSVPDVISSNSKLQLSSVMADMSGRYFAYTAYDSSKDKNNYVLYVWSNNDNCTLIAESDKLITLKDVTKNGQVLYTMTEVLNNQWYLGNSELVVYSVNADSNGTISGTGRALSQAVSTVSIYEDIGFIICRNTDNSVFTYAFDDPGSKKTISKNVTKLEVESANVDNMYVQDDSIINTDAGADSICYFSDGSWKLLNIKTSDQILLGSGDNSSAVFVHDESDRIIYKVLSSGIYMASETGDGSIVQYKKVDSINSVRDYYWAQNDKSLVYVNGDNELKFIKNGQISNVASDIQQGTLRKVDNDNGFIYLSSATLYYVSNAGSTPKLITEGMENTSITGAARTGTKIYYTSGGILKAVSVSGGSVEDIGKCEDLWVGEE